ncbi:methionine sulfoxide reductase A [Armillaria solidipes]|uniref:peptide-methionine (S)-S-oxide reductase n=1 Tax=Armillaria solidipes TaxID=1076256 RepID=A0A2H3AM40_9AGAR|nr:methionine sulfoxide reductase A [Armillaria solidipes]
MTKFPVLSPARSTPIELPFLKHYPEGKGVININVRYTNGKADATSADYKIVYITDHAEAVNIEFDPAVVGYDELVEFFYHTRPNDFGQSRQGYSVAPPHIPIEYRSAIFMHSPEQATVARGMTEDVQAKKILSGRTVVTEIVEARCWWDAEEYHQLYLFKNPELTPGYSSAMRLNVEH